jgi:hypothetical protein
MPLADSAHLNEQISRRGDRDAAARCEIGDASAADSRLLVARPASLETHRSGYSRSVVVQRFR